ncbi:tetratricopeptide repeat protein [Agrococcus jejuensis]|uniref:Putative thioredoxin n=1 Tax=Agrococcus jejuensis TaxID=399736 RepID=A0A1G8GK41_9MICO|nr:tetratricopeptide repeat protein [Agrococcus jejuensis]SDH94733.1 putative thioredoxin [Agrococcus jejuensis]
MTDRLPASMAGAVDLSGLAARHARPAAPQQAAPADGTAAPQGGVGVIVDVGDADFAQIVELSRTVPVVIDIWAEWCGPCKQLTPILERLVTEYAGRIVLAKVDADQNPQLVQAFQAQSIPTVAAVIGGRPAALFTGAIPEAQVVDVLEQVLAFAAQEGVTGRLPVGEPGEPPEEPAEPPLPPLHQEAHDALDRGDLAAAIDAFERAIVANPRDGEAVAGLANVRLLERLQGTTADGIRQAAAEAPDDVAAQMLVADLDVSGGHVDDAFARLLDLVAATTGEQRQDVRLRLVDLFEIVGADDPRVGAARRRLTTLLY